MSGSCASRITGSSVRMRDERAGQIIHAAKCCRPKPIGDLIAETRQPEAAGRRAPTAPRRFASPECALCRARGARSDVVPPVVIAEDRIDAERRVQPGKLSSPDRMRHPLGYETMRGERSRRARPSDRCRAHWRHRPPAAPLAAHIGTARVQIGNDGDGETLTLRPGRRRDAVVGDHQSFAASRAA